DPLAEVSGRELVTVLEEELANLPERYRDPLLLCYAQGKSTDDIARQLGYSLRTAQRRLRRARDLLHPRLGRRGFVFSTATLSALLLENMALASFPPALAVSTLQAASLVAAGQPLTAGLLSAQALTLSQEVLKAMFWTRLKVTLAAVCVMGALVASGFA